MADLGIIMHAIPLSASRNGHQGLSWGGQGWRAWITLHAFKTRVSSLQTRVWVTNCIAVLVCAQILVFCSCLVAGLWLFPSSPRNAHPEDIPLWLLEDARTRLHLHNPALNEHDALDVCLAVPNNGKHMATRRMRCCFRRAINILQIQSLQIHPCGTHGTHGTQAVFFQSQAGAVLYDYRSAPFS